MFDIDADHSFLKFPNLDLSREVSFIPPPLNGSACAQRERRTHHLVGYGPQLRAGSETDDPPHSFMIGRVNSCLNTKACKKNEAKARVSAVFLRTSADRALTSTGRSLLLSPGVCPCFAPALIMYECCLYPAKTAVAFYSKRSSTVQWQRLWAGL